MNQRQDHAVYDPQSVCVWDGKREAGMPSHLNRHSDHHDDEINTRHWARLTAAMLYLVAMSFFAVTSAVLATSWGQDGLSLLLSEGHMARPTMIYMLAAGGISLGAAFLLLTPWSLPKRLRIFMLILAAMLIFAGLVFATPSILVSVLPFLFLFRFHQEMTPSVAVSSGENHSIAPGTA